MFVLLIFELRNQTRYRGNSYHVIGFGANEKIVRFLKFSFLQKSSVEKAVRDFKRENSILSKNPLENVKYELNHFSLERLLG